MKSLKPILLCLICILLNFNQGSAQSDDLNVKIGKYLFKTKFDQKEFTTTLNISRDGKKIFEETYYDIIPEIKSMDLDNDGRNEILIGRYSGGAHCCTSLYAGRFRSGKFTYTDSVYWGNSFYRFEDLKSDGKQEIVGVNDVYAYVFTNFAQSRFPVLIYAYENNKFVNVTSEFPAQVEESLNGFKNELEEYKGFKCADAGEETFNTDAGAVKAILAAMTEDYKSLGKTDEGYKLIDEFYTCPDRDSFIKQLRNDFLLK
ncbi:MAG: hypothetical protein JSS91_07490 [Bacteroidetes bacterium]|nr:hypothetical protein [Bacteroidota bacterium]